ncbi:hypothetical protein AM493_12920 [Flavobacterium akiainvivens]|uniref:Uncharacterized protein n=1 Tax=Flavobacterium akiainvivens TaxID=1202724 RepID=A0A0M9VIM5_9FLAO|nr:hypothetical protein [Flavobacterium akiainvivens]KOS06826.1 hypothetical protein AM493_12920 [Flavobacterium akiainvivens]SFQ75156.1 hypothetical protein SAMN05444144_12124 [Flavobacterium akiainvivens]
MKNHLLKKVMALSLFVSGISVFVLYQSGYFTGNANGTYQGSHNGGAVTDESPESFFRKKADSIAEIDRIIMSSSKVAIPASPQMRRHMDSLLKAKNIEIENPSFFPSSKVMIPSAKFSKLAGTGPVIEVREIVDGVLADSVRATTRPVRKSKKQ